MQHEQEVNITLPPEIAWFEEYSNDIDPDVIKRLPGNAPDPTPLDTSSTYPFEFLTKERIENIKAAYDDAPSSPSSTNISDDAAE